MKQIKNLKPYNTITVGGKTYDDYSFKINGVVYDASVCRETHKFYIRKDENQGVTLCKRAE